MNSMSVERGIRFDLIARLCPNTTGAELRSVATEVNGLIPLIYFTTNVIVFGDEGRDVCNSCTSQSCDRTRLFRRRGEGGPTRNEILKHVSD
jgi:hypothetical protein